MEQVSAPANTVYLTSAAWFLSHLRLPPDFISTYCVVYNAVVNFYTTVAYYTFCSAFFSLNKVS